LILIINVSHLLSKYTKKDWIAQAFLQKSLVNSKIFHRKSTLYTYKKSPYNAKK
jgi:hypothetical protein